MPGIGIIPGMLKTFTLRLFILGAILMALVLILGNLNSIFFPKGAYEVVSQFNANKDYSYLYELLSKQNPGVEFFNPIKHAIRKGIEAQVPVETITLLLLLPLVASIIAGARHLIGLRGFGIFLPAALAASFI